MCGISGLFAFDGAPDSDQLAAMNQEVVHRGPDDAGVYMDGSVGLAHRRLSIIDIQTGKQPIFNEDRSVVTIFNGEIYNYKRLRDSLVSAGHTFTTDTDTEVLVHLYEEHGPDFVDRLQGMYAFALWDSDEERLMLARDPMGIKPLFVAETTDRVGFASELPSLLAVDLEHGGLDLDALAEYFAFGHIPAPRSVFRNVSKLEPGECAVITESGVQRSQFYRPEIPARDPGFESAAGEVRSRVETAVEDRLMSDVPLGAFLSGGIDSSIVVGTMAELSDDPIDTFTVGFEQDLYDESWAAREVAEYHGTNHHEFTMRVDDVREIVPDVLSRLGEPFADQSLLPSYLVARETSQDVKVALSGDGADELFGGYDRYRAESLSKYYRALPEPVRGKVVEPLADRIPAPSGTRVGDLVFKGQWFIDRSGSAEVSDRHFEMLRIFGSSATPAYDAVDPVERGKRALEARHRRLPDELRRRDDLTRIQAVDLGYSLPNQMLHKVDLASMFNSLEVRVPFIDTSLVEYVLSLPVEYKLTGRSRKRVLKRAFDDVLPASIFERPKHGFDMPIGEWFRSELADEFRELVSAVDTGVLDDGAVRKIHDEHVGGRRDHGKFLWSVYVFKHWGRRMKETGVL